VVVKDGAQVRPEELGEFLATKFAKWQLPDGFVFSDELPRTSVGKLLKLKLRETYAGWNCEG
jgi:fatty-acyl-CoA synthase